VHGPNRRCEKGGKLISSPSLIRRRTDRETVEPSGSFNVFHKQNRPLVVNQRGDPDRHTGNVGQQPKDCVLALNIGTLLWSLRGFHHNPPAVKCHPTDKIGPAGTDRFKRSRRKTSECFDAFA
jgi:hypothetical protein